MGTPENAARLGLTVEINLVAPNSINVPSSKLSPLRWLTVHETDNERPGMGARAHRNFVAGGGGAAGVSFTYAVDSERAVQILPDDNRQVAQGNAVGNRESASIETCVNSDGDWNKTLDNLAKLAASFLVAHGLTIAAVRQHNSWSGKECPRKIRAAPGRWEGLLDSIKSYMQQLSAPTPPVESMVMNGFEVRDPFLRFWRQHGGLPIFGFPITARVEMDFGGSVGRIAVQWFERARFELHPGGVMLGRVGVEALEAA